MDSPAIRAVGYLSCASFRRIRNLDTPSLPLPFSVVVPVRVVATMFCTSRPSPVTFGYATPR